MSIYLGNNLIAPNQSNSANKSLSNLDATGQAIIDGKADIDLTNINNSGTSRSAGWAMPSSTFDNLTLGASGTDYTAPANGWFTFSLQGFGGNNGMMRLDNRTAGNLCSYCTSASSGTSTVGVSIPALKGQIVRVFYTSSYTQPGYFRFVYAVGSESEAS